MTNVLSTLTKLAILLVVLFGSVATHLAERHLACGAEYERVVHLEGELIDFCLTIIHDEQQLHEGEDVHNFSTVLRFLEVAREHHDDILSHEQEIIENPLAMFQLKKYLKTRWPPILEYMEGNTDLMRKHTVLQGMFDKYRQTISDIDLSQVVREIINLMRIYDLSVNSVVLGTFGPAQIPALESDDIIKIAESANDYGDHEIALQFLQTGLEKQASILTSEQRLIFQHHLGATHIMLAQLEEAKSVFEEILHKNASSRVARSSLRLIEQKQESIHNCSHDSGINKTLTHVLNRYCHGHLFRARYLEEKLLCYNIDLSISNETVRVEELNRHPRIVLIYDVYTERQQKQLVAHAADKLWNILDGSFRKFHTNKEGTSVHFSSKKTWWAENYSNRLRNITYRSELGWRDNKDILSLLSVTNHGAGMRDNLFEEIPNHRLNLYEEQKIARFHIFLNEPGFGGGLVFPDCNLRIEPKAGAAVFWQHRLPGYDVIPGLRSTISCPVLVGTQWNLVTPVLHSNILDVIYF